jgi:hypothetical protein
VRTSQRTGLVTAVKYLNALHAGNVGIHARVEGEGCMAMQTSTGKRTQWEFYRVEEDGLEQFLGYAEPWQEPLLDRLVDRFAERWSEDWKGTPPPAFPLLGRAS